MACVVVRVWALGQLPGSEHQLDDLKAGLFISLSLAFLICKMGVQQHLLHPCDGSESWCRGRAERRAWHVPAPSKANSTLRKCAGLHQYQGAHTGPSSGIPPSIYDPPVEIPSELPSHKPLPNAQGLRSSRGRGR